MTASAVGTRVGYLGFGDLTRVVGFAIGVAAIVLGALILADGILEFASVSGMPSYLNAQTLIFGNLVWWVDVVVGAVLVGLGAVLSGFSRFFRR